MKDRIQQLAGINEAESAFAAYKEKRKKIDKDLRSIESLLRAWDRDAEGTTDWGYSGSMAQVSKMLGEIVDHLMG